MVVYLCNENPTHEPIATTKLEPNAGVQPHIPKALTKVQKPKCNQGKMLITPRPNASLQNRLLTR